MHPNAALIDSFYKAFAVGDADAMVACYHPEVHFSDPVFTDLRGERAGAMWKMLTGRAKDLRIVHSDVSADDREGRAHWEADYTFGATGLPVHNVIDARFTFRDGRIVRHVDTFDFPKWAGQALGWKGRLLGGFGFLHKGVQKKALEGLDAFMAKKP